jgi:hypothetical protein
MKAHRSLCALLILGWGTSGRCDNEDGWSDPFSKLGWKLPESMQVHGFLSQGYLRTTGNEFFGHSTNMGSLDFREIGLNGSWRPLPNLQFSAQLVSRQAGRTDSGYVRLDFGLASYTFISDNENIWGLRFGRIVNPYGLYNDTRDMPFTRPSILLPQSIYFDVNRQLSLSSDGFQLFGEHHGDFGDFYLQANGGYPRTNDPDFQASIPYGNMDGELSWIGRLMYERDGGSLRLGVTSGNVNTRYHHDIFSPFENGSLHLQPIIFSAQYNSENWTLTSEYALRHLTTKDFGPLLPSRDYWGESYYVQGTYRLASDWEAFLRYDVLCWHQSDCAGKQWEARTGEPAVAQFAKDLALGVRWDITPSIMLRTEYHYVNGAGWVSSLENRDGLEQHWHLFALSASFRF